MTPIPPSTPEQAEALDRFHEKLAEFLVMAAENRQAKANQSA